MKLWRAVAPVVVILASHDLSAQTAARYFPLETGNEWVLARAGDGNAIHIQVGEARSVLGTACSMVTGLLDEAVCLREDPSGRLLRVDPGTGTETLLYDFAAAVGARWETSVHTCSRIGSVASRSAEVTAGFGVARGLLEVVYPDVFQCGYERELFSPGVGLVQRVVVRGPAVMRYELLFARVGPLVITSPALGLGIRGGASGGTGATGGRGPLARGAPQAAQAARAAH